MKETEPKHCDFPEHVLTERLAEALRENCVGPGHEIEAGYRHCRCTDCELLAVYDASRKP